MTKYIHAERLKDSMFAYYDCLDESAKGRPYKGDTLMDYEVVDMIEDCIDNAPTADVVEVKRARWDCVNESDNVWMCTGDNGCGGEFILNDGTPIDNEMMFCPYCGAKMDGGKAE